MTIHGAFVIISLQVLPTTKWPLAGVACQLSGNALSDAIEEAKYHADVDDLDALDAAMVEWMLQVISANRW